MFGGVFVLVGGVFAPFGGVFVLFGCFFLLPRASAVFLGVNFKRHTTPKRGIPALMAN